MSKRDSRVFASDARFEKQRKEEDFLEKEAFKDFGSGQTMGRSSVSWDDEKDVLPNIPLPIETSLHGYNTPLSLGIVDNAKVVPHLKYQYGKAVTLNRAALEKAIAYKPEKEWCSVIKAGEVDINGNIYKKNIYAYPTQEEIDRVMAMGASSHESDLEEDGVKYESFDDEAWKTEIKEPEPSKDALSSAFDMIRETMKENKELNDVVENADFALKDMMDFSEVQDIQISVEVDKCKQLRDQNEELNDVVENADLMLKESLSLKEKLDKVSTNYFEACGDLFETRYALESLRLMASEASEERLQLILALCDAFDELKEARSYNYHEGSHKTLLQICEIMGINPDTSNIISHLEDLFQELEEQDDMIIDKNDEIRNLRIENANYRDVEARLNSAQHRIHELVRDRDNLILDKDRMLAENDYLKGLKNDLANAGIHQRIKIEDLKSELSLVTARLENKSNDNEILYKEIAKIEEGSHDRLMEIIDYRNALEKAKKTRILWTLGAAKIAFAAGAIVKFFFPF